MNVLPLLALLLGPLGFQEAVLALSGASCIEELTEDEVQHYRSLEEHPVEVNSAGRSRLLSCGLFTPYQVASLVDYRARNGDILSFAELSLVDGFAEAPVEALKNFLTIESRNAPGQLESKLGRVSLTVGNSLKDGSFGGKIRCEAAFGEKAEAYWSDKADFSGGQYGIGTVSGAYYGSKVLGKIVLGHFNARFGQGLLAWSGFSTDSYSSSASFSRRPSGISATGSTLAEHLGAAADFNFGRFTLSTAWSPGDKFCLANLAAVWRNLSAGLCVTREGASASWRVSLPSASVFGEAAYLFDGDFAAAAGVLWVPSYGNKFNLTLKRFPLASKGYDSAAIGYEGKRLIATADAGYRKDKQKSRFRALFVFREEISRGDSLAIKPQARFSAKLRPQEKAPLKLELRTDCGISWKSLRAAARIHLAYCRNFSILSYLEAGHSTEKFSLRLRTTFFSAPTWDDRLYAWMPDAPGNFNIPAFYGKGWALSAHSAMHLGRHHSIWLTGEYTAWPWNDSPKDNRFRVSLQYRLKLF